MIDNERDVLVVKILGSRTLRLRAALEWKYWVFGFGAEINRWWSIFFALGPLHIWIGQDWDFK
jgi:hypothetical protein